MTIDSASYRKAIGLLATGVTVIAAESDEGVRGMTANAVTSVSLDPILLLVCVAKKARMAGVLRSAGHFTVNILAEYQESASMHFAGQALPEGAPVPEFVAWERGHRLAGAVAALVCEPYAWFEAGDHWIVTGKVIAIHRADPPGPPLVYHQGRYARLEPGRDQP